MPNTHSVQGYGAPTTAPAAVNVHYLDLLSGKPYLSVGTKSPADWRLIADMAPVQSINGKSGNVTISQHEVGDLLLSLRAPGSKYVAPGDILLQSDYPALFSVVGLIEAGPATTEKWRTRSSDLGSAGNQSVRSIRTDGNGVWIATFATGSLMRSADNGATWQEIAVSGIGSKLATDGNGNWLATAYTGATLYRSTDNGLTWSAVDTSAVGTPYDVDIAPNGVAVWCGYAGKLARSTDFGQTWTAVTSGFSTTVINGVRTDGAGNWVIVGNAAKNAYSADDGVSFTMGSTSGLNSANLNNVETDGAGVWVCGSSETDRIGRSVNGGASWTGMNVTGRRLRHINGGEWIAGTSGGFMRSVDGAATWSSYILQSGGIADIARGDDGIIIGVPFNGDLIEPAPTYPYNDKTHFKVPPVAAPEGVGAFIRALP